MLRAAGSGALLAAALLALVCFSSADVTDGKDRLRKLRGEMPPRTGDPALDEELMARWRNRHVGAHPPPVHSRRGPEDLRTPDEQVNEVPFVPKVTAANGTVDGTEKWAYVDVRPGAHMFWWLYFTYHPDGWQNRPIIIWLQGGPGSSSTGYGNFELLGPLNVQLEPRNTTWVKLASVLFIDNPVGAGYSYVDSPSDYTTDVTQIAIDLVTCWKAFLTEFPAFRTIPLYVFGESYGGKMGAVFAQHLYQAINDPLDPLITNLAGFAMGNSFVSPFDSTFTWAPWLYAASNLDEQGVERVERAANASKAAADRGDWVGSTNLWIATEVAVLQETNDIDFYYILRYTVSAANNNKKLRMPGHKQATPWNGLPPRRLYISEDAYRINLQPFAEDELYVLMNTEIRAKLGIIPPTVIWDGQSDACFNAQAGDFMKDVIAVVGDMATNTNVTTVVYQGQLDLICDTSGALNWVNRLPWDGLQAYYSAPKVPLVDPWSLQTDTFVKVYENFKFYWNLRAGHMVPKDDGNGAYRMVERIISNADTYP